MNSPSSSEGLLRPTLEVVLVCVAADGPLSFQLLLDDGGLPSCFVREGFSIGEVAACVLESATGLVAKRVKEGKASGWVELAAGSVRLSDDGSVLLIPFGCLVPAGYAELASHHHWEDLHALDITDWERLVVEEVVGLL